MSSDSHQLRPLSNWELLFISRKEGPLTVVMGLTVYRRASLTFYFFSSTSLMVAIITLENDFTRTAQSSRGGCSRRVQKILFLAVKKDNILVTILLLKILISNYCHS